MGYDNADLEHRILEEAIAALEKNTGLRATVVDRETAAVDQRRLDARIEIDDDGKRFHLQVEIKTRIDREAALAAAHTQIRRFLGELGVLVTPYLPPKLVDHCREDLNLQFIDTAGNAYLRQPGLHVLVTGQRRPALPADFAPTYAAGTTTALRINFLLLCRPDLLNAPYREIAAAAGVALGAVGPALQNLTDRQYLIGGPGKRHLVEPVKLFEEWVMNYPTRLRPKLKARRFTAATQDWWKGADLKDTGAFWGAEVAADKLTNHLKPATCTLYVRPYLTKQFIATTAERYRWRADLKGNIEILEAFWKFPTDPRWPDVVPAPLVYADLVATLDPRNLEVAELVRTQYIEDTLRKV
jgi:hypothetical protein